MGKKNTEMFQKIKIAITFIYIVHIMAAMAIDCRDPDPIENGYFNTMERTDSRWKLKYNCDPGYGLVGRTVRNCYQSGWENRAPTCEPKTCGNPGELLNGYYEAESVLFGSTATFYCIPGYKMIGSSKRICDVHGWTGQVPQCNTIKCNGFQPINNMIIPTPSYRDDWENGMVAKFSCTGDYSVIGAEELVCTESGEWNELPPICKDVQCTRPPVPANGQIVAGFGPRYKYRETITYRCDKGYGIKGNNVIECAENNIFLTEPPSCILTGCRRPWNINNGRVINPQDVYALYETITFACDYGYKTFDQTFSQCKENNTFMPPLPSCQIVTCDAPQDILNGKVMSQKRVYLHREWATFRCNEGYKIQSGSKRECRSDGKFQSPLPICQIVTCYTPRTIPNGKLTSHKGVYQYGATATFRCDEGSRPLGENEIVCKEHGRFVPTPTCQRVTCYAPRTIPNGKLMSPKYSYQYGATATFKCDKGFRLLGENEIVCNEHGRFVPPIPTCQRVDPISDLKSILLLGRRNIDDLEDIIRKQQNLLNYSKESLKLSKFIVELIEKVLNSTKV